MKTLLMWSLMTLISLCTSVGCAAEAIWVAPGHHIGVGSQENPYSFAQVFSGTDVQVKPGSIVYLKDGRYTPPPLLAASETAPPANPPTSKPTEERPAEKYKAMLFAVKVKGTADQPIKVMPAPGASVFLEGYLDMESSHLHLINLEIGNSKHDPKGLYPPVVNLNSSRNIHLINCNLFGGGSTVTSMQTSKDITVYGSLVHDSCGLPHGASHFYTHNPKDSTKVVEHCVAYRSSGYNVGVHVYNSDAAYNFLVLENIIFHGGLKEPQRNQDNIFINPGYPASNIQIVGNVVYQHETSKGWRPNVRLSMKATDIAKKYDYTSDNAVVKDNWFMGGPFAVSMGRWKNMTFQDNVLWGKNWMMEINSATSADGIPPQDKKPDLSGYQVDRNHYFAAPDAAVFRYDRIGDVKKGDPMITFAQWQALGLDKNGSLEKTVDGHPTGTMVRVYPNRYQKGRANVAIFSWDNHDTVKVDLSKVLAKGDKFKVYNCLDVMNTFAMTTPVLTGTYDGNEVPFPMKKDPTSPHFDAFVVLPEIPKAD